MGKQTISPFYNNGFTLIELLIVIVIIGILSAIVFPAYLEHTTKTRRSTAQADLMTLASYAERIFTEKSSYVDVSVDESGINHDNYTYSIIDKTKTTYTLKAVPTGAQASDTCGTLKLKNTGETESESNSDCW